MPLEPIVKYELETSGWTELPFAKRALDEIIEDLKKNSQELRIEKIVYNFGPTDGWKATAYVVEEQDNPF